MMKSKTPAISSFVHHRQNSLQSNVLHCSLMLFYTMKYHIPSSSFQWVVHLKGKQRLNTFFQQHLYFASILTALLSKSILDKIFFEKYVIRVIGRFKAISIVETLICLSSLKSLFCLYFLVIFSNFIRVSLCSGTSLTCYGLVEGCDLWMKIVFLNIPFAWYPFSTALGCMHYFTCVLI